MENTAQTEFLGYVVEWTNDDKAPVVLRGQRGGVYGLMRHDRSRRCFAVKLRGAFAAVVGLKGNYTFKVEGGRIECANGF